MRKNFRLILGIVLHWPRLLRAALRRRKYENIIRERVRDNWWHINHETMHWMSKLTNTGYTESDLYKDLYRGSCDPPRY